MGSVSARQSRILNSLKAHGADPLLYKAMRKCRVDKCLRSVCCLACAYGAAKARKQHLSSAKVVLSDHEGPFWRVLICREAWSRDVCNLRSISLNAVRKMYREGLDRLRNPGVIAIGSIQLAHKPGASSSAGQWSVWVVAIVAGATREDIETALALRRPARLEAFLMVAPISDMDAALSSTLVNNRPGIWRDTTFPDRRSNPSKKLLGEYYRWLLNLSPSGLVVRYGCDRHFNRIIKVLKPEQPRKRRRFPKHLERYFFGTETREKMDLERARRKAQH